MSFKRFVFIGKTVIPRLTISEKVINFNYYAMQKFEIKKFKFAVFFIDEKERKIGIMLTNNEKEEGAKNIRKYSYGITSISAQNFISEYNLFKGKNSKLKCYLDKKTNMIIADY